LPSPAQFGLVQRPICCPARDEWFVSNSAPLASTPLASPAFRIISPADGDRYQIPPGMEARYATIALRAESAQQVRWFIDGKPHGSSRWQLSPGRHAIRAVAGERSDEVIVDVR